MEKFFNSMGASTVLIICGTILAVYSHQILSITLISLGVLGSIVKFSINIQKENQEKEERARLYEDIKKTVSSVGVNIPYVTSSGNDQVH